MTMFFTLEYASFDVFWAQNSFFVFQTYFTYLAQQQSWWALFLVDNDLTGASEAELPKTWLPTPQIKEKSKHKNSDFMV